MNIPSRLLVVSHTPHHRDAEGRIVGFGPTVRELDHLASRFEHLAHLAPLHAGSPPASSLAYESPNVEVIPLRPAGGPRLVDKVRILARYPGYFLALARNVRRIDAVHVRCPANLSLLTILALALLPGLRRDRPWWVKYAGNWRPDDDEPPSYRFQRAFLRRSWTGLRVSVNGSWADQPAHVRTFENPCLTSEELEEARLASRDKTLDRRLRLLFVGNLDDNKGASLAIEATARLPRDSRPPDHVLDLVGDGPRRADLEALVHRLGLRSSVRFHGALPRSEIAAFYRPAHLLLVPSRTEGWPKVIAEGMAHGVVPVASAVSCIPSTLRELGVGRCPRERTAEAFAEAIQAYFVDPAGWLDESRRAREAAGRFTYDRHLAAVEALFADLRSPNQP